MSALLNRFYNFHWVVGATCARSAQPYLGQWRRFLTDNGIASIINLRGAHPDRGWWRRETGLCARMGVAHFDTAFNSRKLPQRGQILAIVGFIDAAQTPVLIKCSGGQDRTSFVSALYILHTQGWDGWETAMRHFARYPYLHFPKRHQRWLRQFFVFARQRAAGKPIAAWIAAEYDPQSFARWLADNDHRGSFRRIDDPYEP